MVNQSIVFFCYNETGILTRVIPDGCRDIILSVPDNTSSSWFVSDLNDSTYAVCAGKGDRMTGIRMKPGVSIDQRALSLWAENKPLMSLFESDQLDEFCVLPEVLSSALQCLGSGIGSVALVARSLGVSSRTLRRVVKTGTGRHLSFWLSFRYC